MLIFTNRVSAKTALPLVDLFVELETYAGTCVVESAQTLSIDNVSLTAFVTACKVYALSAPNGALPRYDLFDLAYKDIVKFSTGRPTSPLLTSWIGHRVQVCNMFNPNNVNTNA